MHPRSVQPCSIGEVQGTAMPCGRDMLYCGYGRLYVVSSNRDGRGDPRPGDDRIYRLEPTG